MTRKSLSVLALATASFFLLLITSKRLGSWSSFDGPPFHANLPGHRHPPHGSFPGDRRPSNATDADEGIWGNHGAQAGDHLPRPGPDPACRNFPDTKRILLVMKTGASESFDKIPTQLLTGLRCVSDYLIFSDKEEIIAGEHIHDSLDTVIAEAKDGNGDFDLYRRQQACAVDQDSCNKLGNPSSEGWNLDKYKNVHIAEKTYTMRPGYDWYVFIDADTYVLWPNLVQWLGTIDHTKKHYIGSVTLINNYPFGHGGSGYLVSHAAMHQFIGQHPGIASNYDVRAKSECCGDFMFALALKDTTGVGVKQVWPTINGEKPFTLPYGPSHWCHPIVTMHHMNSEEINSFWEFERRRYSSLHPDLPSVHAKPLVIKDIYTEFFAPKMQEKREDWDNLSNDRLYLDKNDSSHKWEDSQLSKTKEEKDLNEFEKKAHLSFADCARACESLGTDECFQYRYQDGVCGTSKAFMLGHPVKKEDVEKKRSMAGWDVKKILKWIEDQGECQMVKWPDTSHEYGN